MRRLELGRAGGTKTHQAAQSVRLQLISDELKSGDVVIIHHVLAVGRVVLVQPVADPIQQKPELLQRGVGGVHVYPVLHHLQYSTVQYSTVHVYPVLHHLLAELALDVLALLQLGGGHKLKRLGAKSTEVTDLLVKVLCQHLVNFLKSEQRHQQESHFNVDQVSNVELNFCFCWRGSFAWCSLGIQV